MDEYEAPLEPMEPKRQPRGCLFYGCLTAGIVGLLALVFIGLAVLSMYRAYSQLVAQYTSTAPMELPRVELPKEVAMFVAQRVRSNVRELEGALLRLSASSRLRGEPLTVEFARATLKDMLAAYERMVTIDNIKRTVAAYYNIRVADLNSPRRTRSLARPRQVAMALAKELTQHSLPEIGESFGKDHTTVLHACRKIAELREEDVKYREDYENLQRQLGF